MRLASLAVLAALLALPSLAHAAPEDDFILVYNDYTGADGSSANDVRSCQWTREQLVNAKTVAQQSADFAYYTAFISEVDTEIARWDSGFCAGVVPDPGGGSQNPTGDYKAVFDDWAADGRITPCKFTRQQLVSALNVASQTPDIDAYAPGFREAVRQEIARIDRGECGSTAAATKLAITRIRAKKGKKEFVTIKNVGSTAVALRSLRLRDKQRSRIRLPRFALRRGRSLRVVTGCFKKSKKPRRRGNRFYACKRKAIWGNKGDVVKIVNSRGTVLAQRGYGRFRSVPRF
jgi:Lamin Tail Domain